MMKRVMILLLFISMTLIFLGCFPKEDKTDNLVVSFQDANLEMAVRVNVLKTTGDLLRKDVRHITTLDATGFGIEYLNGIEHLESLEVLILENNRIKDLTPLQTATNLEVLNLRNNQIHSLAGVNFNAVGSLPKLKSLNLRHNVFITNQQQSLRLSDVSLLATMTQLETLDLRDNQIMNIQPLASLVNLIELDISLNPIEDHSIEVLAPLIRLEHLNLRETDVHTIGVVSLFTSLRYLNIHSNVNVASIAPIQNLTNLETLIARDVPIGEDISYLSNLTSLQRINLRNTGIVDLRILASLMAQGALQDNMALGILASVDIQDNPIPPYDGTESHGYHLLLPYWGNISEREPYLLQAASTKSVVINEFMSSNGFTLFDEDGDFEDWIELYNTTNEPYDLSGYYLSDSDNNLFKWQFPNGTIIGPNGYLIVFASGKNKIGSTGELHTSFRISKAGEPLILSDDNQIMVLDYIEPLFVTRDYSYGRYPDGSNHWVYFHSDETTPGTTNNHSVPYDGSEGDIPPEIIENIESFNRLFNDEVTKSFVVQISRAEWDLYDQTMIDYASRFNGELRLDYYARADLLFEDANGSVLIENIGFRTRGNLSRVRIQDDNGNLNMSHFKFSFDEHFNDPALRRNNVRTVFELEEIDLKWNRNWDSTYLTEKFSMDLFNAYDVHAASTTLAALYIEIDGVRHFYGIYTIFEPIDRHFVNRRYDDEAALGDLYKNLWQQYGPAPLHIDFPFGAIGIKDTVLNYRPAYDLKTNKDQKNYALLIEFMTQISTLEGHAFKTYLEANFEVDALLRLLAVGVLLGNPDDYRAMANNYYFYHNPVTNKWMMIPYDYDHGLAQGWDGSPVFFDWTVGADIYEWGKLTSVFLGQEDFAHPLTDKLFAFAEYQLQYEAHLRALIDPNNGLFTLNHFLSMYHQQKSLYDDIIDDAMMAQPFGLRNIEWYFNAKIADIQQQLDFYENNPHLRGN